MCHRARVSVALLPLRNHLVDLGRDLANLGHHLGLLGARALQYPAEDCLCQRVNIPGVAPVRQRGQPLEGALQLFLDRGRLHGGDIQFLVLEPLDE